jgi:hypothetical protein
LHKSPSKDLLWGSEFSSAEAIGRVFARTYKIFGSKARTYNTVNSNERVFGALALTWHSFLFVLYSTHTRPCTSTSTDI